MDEEGPSAGKTTTDERIDRIAESAGDAAKKAMRWLAGKDYRPVWHVLSILAIMALACFLFYKSFGNHGTIMATDMTWPSTISRMQFRVVNTWFPYGSVPNTATLEWFFWVYPTSLLAKAFGLAQNQYQFMMFYGVFAMAGVSMYALTYRTIREVRLDGMSKYAPFVGAVFAGFVYMYNPWSVRYLRPYFGYPIYAFLPLLFIALVKTFEKPTVRNIILFTIFASVVNTSHHLLWFLGLLVAYFIYYLVRYRLTRETLKNALKPLIGVPVLYFFINAMWTLPYVGAQLAGKPLLPYYSPLFNESSLVNLSTNNSMSNNMRLVSSWAWNVELLKGSLGAQAILFAIPLLAIAGYLLLRRETRRSNTVNFWAAVAVLALLLATGTSWILSRGYRFFVFDAPGSSSYGWMLRASEKWLFFVPLFFALMLGLLVARTMVRRPVSKTTGEGVSENEKRLVMLENRMDLGRYRRSLLVGFLVVVLVAVSMYPLALDLAQRVYNPADVPPDYARLNAQVNKTKGEPRVAWLPFFPPSLFTYAWAPEKKIGAYSIMSSNPNLNSIREVMNPDSYFNWLEDIFMAGSRSAVKIEETERMLKRDIAANLFMPFSANYLILDRSVMGYMVGSNFYKDRSLDKSYQTKYLTAYTTDHHPGYIWPATRTLVANSFYDNLAVTQKLPHQWIRNLAFTDGRSHFGGSPDVGKRYGGVDIDDYMEALTPNPGFEQLGEGWPFSWHATTGNPKGKVSTDTKVKAGGKRSLRVDNRATQAFGFTWITGDQQVVPANSICAIETKVKYRNSNWTMVAVEGWDDATWSWKQIVKCPNIGSGDSPWKKYYCSFWLPDGITIIRPVMAAGWVKDAGKGAATSWFDDIRLSRVNDFLYADVTNGPKPPKITFEKQTAEKYQVRVKSATEPFVLVQSETYDPLWVARVDGRDIEPLAMYSTINGYRISKKGDYTLVIEYRPQKYANWGFLVSFLVLLCSLAFVGVDVVRRKRGRPEKVRHTGKKAERPKKDKRVRRKRRPRGSGVLGRIRSWIEQPPRSGARGSGV